MKHEADWDRKELQLRAFYAKLRKGPKGNLLSQDALRSWCEQEGIPYYRACLILRGQVPEKKSGAPFNAEVAAKYAAYLRKHGYQVIEPTELPKTTRPSAHP